MIDDTSAGGIRLDGVPEGGDGGIDVVVVVLVQRYWLFGGNGVEDACGLGEGKFLG